MVVNEQMLNTEMDADVSRRMLTLRFVAWYRKVRV
jgi:hypothetical protein